MIMTCGPNVLENSTVDLLAGTQDPLFPLWRLSDRNIGKIFAATAAETVSVRIDQGAAPLPVDRLIIPPAHTLAGVTLNWKCSDIDSGYADVIAGWAPADNGLINKTPPAAFTHRFQRFVINTPGVIPQLAELYLTSTFAWTDLPDFPSGPLDPEPNVTTLELSGGGDRFVKNGDLKRRRTYVVSHCGAAQKNAMVALNALWEGRKPFWMCDLDGVWIYVKLTQKMNIREVKTGQWSYVFDALEVLPI